MAPSKRQPVMWMFLNPPNVCGPILKPQTRLTKVEFFTVTFSIKISGVPLFRVIASSSDSTRQFSTSTLRLSQMGKVFRQIDPSGTGNNLYAAYEHVWYRKLNKIWLFEKP